jgi:hypothetical protein
VWRSDGVRGRKLLIAIALYLLYLLSLTFPDHRPGSGHDYVNSMLSPFSSVISAFFQSLWSKYP